MTADFGITSLGTPFILLQYGAFALKFCKNELRPVGM
jgi:hypothetical protein